jgi:1-aminocyclopropane-1-carboxylate deaminase/D-cysteine desulfhydrase-like pyridoxal-dependent ACC family enzyme
VKETSAHIGISHFIPSTCFDEYVGPGYALPTPEMVEAVQLIAKQKQNEFYSIQCILVKMQQD